MGALGYLWGGTRGIGIQVDSIMLSTRQLLKLHSLQLVVCESSSCILTRFCKLVSSDRVVCGLQAKDCDRVVCGLQEKDPLGMAASTRQHSLTGKE